MKQQMFINIGYMLLGVIIVSLIVLLFFAFNGAIGDLFFCYFYKNIFGYQKSISFILRLKSVLNSNRLLIIVLAVGVILGFVKFGVKSGYISLSFLAYFVYLLMMKGYSYYYLPLTFFSLFSFIVLFSFLPQIHFKKVFGIIICCAVFLVSGILSYFFSNSKDTMFRPKNEYAQIQIAEKIKSFELENPTLFCYKMMDYGFYNACGIVPNVKYFAKNNFSVEAFPEMYNSFDETIKEKKVDFVIALENDYSNNLEMFNQNYELIGKYSYRHYEDTKSEIINFVLLKKC